MPSKTEEYLALAQRTANGLTRYWESWTAYLTTASRLYKYPFADQLMIYAQRPDATACADFDIWNSRMNRYVRRGAKGIALLDESSGFPRLHYVFDVSDTGVRRNSRDPEVWQYNDDLKQPVSEMLNKTYGISGERVSQQLADVAGKLVADYWDNNGGDIRAIVDGSLLMDYDEAGVEMQFKSAAAISVTYTLLERCGFEPAGWFDKDDFQAIYNFSTPDSVYALGTAVSDMSREVLRQIERTVKTTIRRRNAERSQYEYEQQERDLLDRRGLPAPEPDPEPAPEAAGQVRQAAPDVPDEPSPGAVQHNAPEREPVPAPDGSGTDGREPDAADHGAASETEPGPGQGEPANGMGAAHEQPESAGRGTGADGADLQLSFLDAVLPTEDQQLEKIDQAESEKSSSTFVLSQAEIENELRKHGSGFTGGKQRIMALYQTQPDRKLRAKALAKEYGIGGHSHDFLDGSRGFVNHDWKGLEFDHYPDHQKITLKWAQVEKYIDLMIQSDRYLTDKEKEHYTPPAPVSAKPDATLTRAKNLIREFCQEEYDSEPDFSNLAKIDIAYTHATDEDIPIQVNVDLVGYRVERYLGEVLIDERQYESLEDLTETELEALDFSELVSVTDGTRKFRDFFFSALAVQRLSDLICLEHQLSVIEIKPYRERQKRTLYPPRESNRDRLCSVIDNILAEKLKDYEGFLQRLEQQGYEVKRGKYTSVKGARQKRFIRFRTLGAGYSEEELKAVLAGEAEHRPRQKCPAPEQKFQMLVDIQAKLAEGKGAGFARWAKQHNLKEMSRTLVFLQENKIGSIEEMQERVDAATARYHELGDSIKASEKRLAEIAVLKAHIINYAKTRPVYDAYRKTGYSKRFLETHRTEITLHKAAKAAFDEVNLKTLPKVKELDAEYSKLLTEKKARYPDYRKAKEEMQELLRAQKNIELFFDEEKNPKQTEHSR